MPTTTLHLSPAELDTVLAALRLWQVVEETDRLPPPDVRQALDDIALEHGGLDAKALDDFCEKLNTTR